jgi:hypothetical protein
MIIYDGVINREQDKSMREAYESDPLLQILPYTHISDGSGGLIYVIEASYDDGVHLLVRLNTCSEASAAVYKGQSLEWIRSQGFDPGNYPIAYHTLCD